MADENLFTIELVTPERILVRGTATEVILRTREGDVTFLAGHAPLVGTVEPGVVRIVPAEGDEVRAATHGGFVQVEQGIPDDDTAETTSGTRVTMLIGVAELSEEIDVERARVALEAAEARLSELGGPSSRGSGADGEEAPDADRVEAEAALIRARVRMETVDVTSGAPTA